MFEQAYKQYTNDTLDTLPDINTRPPKSNFSSKSSITPLKRRVSSKFNDFDIKGAVRLLSSNNVFAPMVPKTVSSLRSIHPLGDPVSDINSDQIPTAPVMSLRLGKRSSLFLTVRVLVLIYFALNI